MERGSGRSRRRREPRNRRIGLPRCRQPQDVDLSSPRNCHDNFLEAVARYPWGSRAVPNPLNIFMNTSIRDDGTVVTMEPRSQAGDRIIMRAEVNLVGVVSSCPMDLTPTGSDGITDIEVLVSDDLESLQRL